MVLSTSQALVICSCARTTRLSIFSGASVTPAESSVMAARNSCTIRFSQTSETWCTAINRCSSCACVTGWWALVSVSIRR